MNESDDSRIVKKSGIRFLVESALRSVALDKQGVETPKTREAWVAHLCEALSDDSEAAHSRVIAAMMGNGISSTEIFQYYVPEAARYLGELWVQDKASFVDVTVGASRLQALFRKRKDGEMGGWLDRSIPLGQSVLMVIPEFEDHSIGAFVAADQFRRHGLWVHVAIGLEGEELVHLIDSGRFAMVGITVGSSKTLECLIELIDYLRSNIETCPPVVLGGQLVGKPSEFEKRTGADYAVRTARAAIERCGLASVAQTLSIDAGS
ncbi:MAG: cobalamin B12-binding domain-containing protein [Roseovarius sp.]|nr:cobalamin B12-binding domain-containing protein [Roseovarius sp.]